MALFRVFCCVALTYFINYQFCNSQCDNDVTGTAVERDRRSNKDELEVVTYNAEWLYNAGCQDMAAYTKKWEEGKSLPWGLPAADNYHKERYGDDGIAALEIHQTKIAEYLATMDADIYIIQETCDCATLEAVRGKMSNGEEFHSYLVLNDREPTDDGQPSMQTGIITKIDPQPIGGAGGNKPNIQLVDEAEPDDRIFRAVFDIIDTDDNAAELILYGAHLKSGIKSSDITKRSGQAQLLNSKAAQDAERENVYVIIAGDLNTNKVFTVKGTISKKMRDEEGAKDIHALIDKWQLNDDLTTKGFESITAGLKIYAFNIKGGKMKEEIDCMEMNLKSFTSEFVRLATNKTAGSYNYAIYFGEAVLITLSQNGFNYQIEEPTGKAVTHYICLHEQNKYRSPGILDYLFVSKGIMDDLKPKLEYIHQKFMLNGTEKEKVCSYKDDREVIYSDHSPVKVTLDTSNMGHAARRRLMDGNAVNALVGYNIETMIWILFFTMIGIVSSLYLSGYLSVR